MITSAPSVSVYPAGYIRVSNSTFTYILDTSNSSWAEGDDSLCFTLDAFEDLVEGIKDKSIKEELSDALKQLQYKQIEDVIVFV